MSSGKLVLGIAVLKAEVFVVRDETTAVEVYDAETLTLLRHLAATELVKPYDMTSNAKNGSLYIADGGHNGSVHRMTADGRTKYWKLRDAPYGIATAFDGRNVLVSFSETRKLREYTGDGKLVREILLDDSVVRPAHALQISKTLWAVCHGWASDRLQRVCIVDAEGRVVKTHGDVAGSSSSSLDSPLRLALYSRRFLAVADVDNFRILLLGPSPSDVRELISRHDVDRPWRPVRLCLDESRERLYVGDYSNNDILVFRIHVPSAPLPGSVDDGARASDMVEDDDCVMCGEADAPSPQKFFNLKCDLVRLDVAA